MKTALPTTAFSAFAWVVLGVTPPSLDAQIRVVATTPDLAAIAMEIGGGDIEISTLANPTEDPHFVDARPSHIVTLNRADVLIEGGAQLEVGWLPALLRSARNSKIAAGPGRISASAGVTMLEVPTTLDRAAGDIHAAGNPHFMLDPLNVRLIAAQIADHLAQVDPSSAERYRANLERFGATLDTKFADWQRQLAPFRGAGIVTYHRDFVYLAERFGLELVATLEEKPGISPSPAHIARVIETMRSRGARVILMQPYQNRRTAETVARQTGAAVLDMPHQPGAAANTETYFDLMDYLVQTLASGLQQGQ